jgi:Ca-activated chloride channel family protein
MPDEAPESAPVAEAPAQPFDPAAYRAAVQRANAAVNAQDWPNAAKQLEEVLALKPDSKEAAYNLGVARFQQGDFAGARKMFQQSAQNAPADLAARSMYNEGNSIYADVVRNLPPIDPAATQNQVQQAPAVPPEELQKAVQQVEQAFTHFKDAAAANPSDEDSAANAETSLKLLKELRKIQQQQQQQQQQQDSKDQQQQQNQQQQDQQQQNQQQQDQQQQNQQQDASGKQSQDPNDAPQTQQNQHNPDPSKEPQQQDSRNEQKAPPKQDASQQKDEQPDTKQDSKQQPEPKDQQQQQQNQEQGQQPPRQQGKQQAQANNDPSGKQGQGQAAEASQDRMDQTQADRLLQLVRDKEKSRNEQRKAEQARTRSTPVDRDW